MGNCAKDEPDREATPKAHRKRARQKLVGLFDEHLLDVDAVPSELTKIMNEFMAHSPRLQAMLEEAMEEVEPSKATEVTKTKSPKVAKNGTGNGKDSGVNALNGHKPLGRLDPDKSSDATASEHHPSTRSSVLPELETS